MSVVGHSEAGRLDIVLFGGVVGSLFSLLQFISSPIIGRLSDYFGRRAVLLVSMVNFEFIIKIGNGISMFLWIFADSFPIFLASRIVGGLTEGNVQMSIAMITDLTNDSNRSKSLVSYFPKNRLGLVFHLPSDSLWDRP